MADTVEPYFCWLRGCEPHSHTTSAELHQLTAPAEPTSRDAFWATWCRAAILPASGSGEQVERKFWHNVDLCSANMQTAAQLTTKLLKSLDASQNVSTVEISSKFSVDSRGHKSRGLQCVSPNVPVIFMEWTCAFRHANHIPWCRWFISSEKTHVLKLNIEEAFDSETKKVQSSATQRGWLSVALK